MSEGSHESTKITASHQLFERFKVDFSSRSFPRSGNPGSFVTPVKTGVQPHNLDTVFQRYDGRCPSPSPGCRAGLYPEHGRSAGMTNFHCASRRLISTIPEGDINASA